MKKVLAVVVVAVLLLGGGSFAWWNQAEPASLPQQAPAQVVAADVVSPLPAAAPVREAAGLEPVVATEAAPAARSQHFRCIDEQGQPVANAEVRLVRLPWGAGVPDRVARSDAKGEVVIDEVVAANYVIRAREGLRHHVPHYNRQYEALPGAPLELLLCELWIGGLVMPGAEVTSHGCSYGGFQSSRDGEVEKELVAAWSRKHPGAVFRAMFRKPSRALSDTISMRVEWYGHVRHEQQLRMWPASQFRGPEVVDPVTVPACDWASPRIVLVDAAGAPLPEALQAALRERADLHGVRAERRGAELRFYMFRSGSAKLPTGDYELRLFDTRNSQMVPAARCTVARDTTELRIPVAIADRVVRLHLRGLPGAGYMLRIAHESGRTAQEFGSAGGEHTLLLPPGPCLATYNRVLPDGRQESRERAFTITDAVEQEVTWDLAAPPAKR
jgi:predicted ribosomally synthesized peptide with SipW-like signal peptide